jgi:hypothetical protein
LKNRIYLDYVQDIRDSIRDIESFVKGMKFDLSRRSLEEDGRHERQADT